MAIFRCFSILNEKKVKNKVGKERCSRENFDTLLAKLHHSASSEKHDLKPTTLDLTVKNDSQKNSRRNVRVMMMSLESPVKVEVPEVYKTGDENENENKNENENSLSIKRELSNFDLQFHEAVGSKGRYDPTADELEDQSHRYSRKSNDTIDTGHVSDPGIGRTDFLASPNLKRSCSNLETRNIERQVTQYLRPSKPQSFEDFRELSGNPMVNLKRSRSARSHCSADRVMMTRHSSSQVLPSGSKKLWWKLFLLSNRNIHRKFSKKPKLVPAISSLSNQFDYSSNTVELKQSKALRHVQSSSSTTAHYLNRITEDDDDQRESRFQNENSGFWRQKQWFALSTEASSSFSRVHAWVRDLEIQEPVPEDDFLDDNARSVAFPPSPNAGISMIKNTSQLTRSKSNLSMDILKANSMVQSIHPASSVAHMSGVGIKAIPVISHFSNLRYVNLSSNFIVSISPGCLPKSVQTLILSKNKITTLDGLKELTRLRVLDLSYNCISRIGQGLSSCTLIKELYLSRNKISDVEGLHRLFKLTVLDMSFNKITTTKAIGQLVANYNSLQALNILGNPIQRNVSDEQLNKIVSGLLPKLVYLNKKTLKNSMDAGTIE